jgi:hypothetical protein
MTFSHEDQSHAQFYFSGVFPEHARVRVFRSNKRELFMAIFDIFSTLDKNFLCDKFKYFAHEFWTSCFSIYLFDYHEVNLFLSTTHLMNIIIASAKNVKIACRICKNVATKMFQSCAFYQCAKESVSHSFEIRPNR